MTIDPLPTPQVQLGAPPGIHLEDLVQQSAAAVEGMGALDPGYADRLRGLLDRLREGRFHLAVLGQFKRGKSTFVNALLGVPVLPTSVVPLTALPTFLRWGEAPCARVQFQDGRSEEMAADGAEASLAKFLQAFVTEEGNPKNQKGVHQVDVWYPSPLLRQGLVIIDTPGIGSTFRHNTEATLNLLPQCDAAMFLVSADPPMTEVEVAFLRQVRTRMSRILFVLNKVDYLDRDDQRDATAFLQGILEEHLGLPSGTPILAVSSRRALKAAQQGDTAAWEASGLAGVNRLLLDFVTHEKARTLELSVAHKVSVILEEAWLQIQLILQSLKLPIQDLEARLALFEQKIDDIKRERTLAGDLLAGDRKRAHAFLEELSEALRRNARQHFQDLVRLEIDLQERPTEAGLQAILAEVIPAFFEHELGTISARFQQRTEEVLRLHQERSDQLLDGLRRVAAELFELPFHAPAGSGAFEMKRDPYWVSRQWTDSLSPISPAWIDRLLPIAIRKRRILARLQDQVRMLVVRNVENLRWALYQGLDQSLGLFSVQLEGALEKTITTTQGGIHSVLLQRKAAESSTDGEVARFEELRARVEGKLEAARKFAGVLVPVQVPLQPAIVSPEGWRSGGSAVPGAPAPRGHRL